jgi:glycosyltransferase involved in cell wall biosynthesis
MTADAVGGVWTYALGLSRALSRTGTRVTLAALGPPPSSDQRAEALRIPQLELMQYEGRLEWMKDPWDSVRAAGEWLQSNAEKLQPDVIHLNDYSHGALTWPAPSVVVAHSCVVSWWTAVYGSDPPAEWGHYRRSVRSGLLGADATVAVSRAMAQAVARHYAVSAPAVVWNGRSAPECQPVRKEEFVLTSGRVWDEAKNISALCAAADRIAWPVWLAGETRCPDGGEADVAGLKTLGRLPAEQLMTWFGRASVYALPALYEPFGLSVLEAALSGCALVLGDIPSLREIWRDGAVFVDGRDPAAIAEGINRIIADRDLRMHLARRARSRALSLTPERMLTGYRGVYAQARARFGQRREAAARCAS